MDDAPRADQVPPFSLPRRPPWLRPGRTAGAEELAFLSGAALAHLQFLTQCPDLPQVLWRARLALAAARIGAGLSGRVETEQSLRDNLCFTRAGDRPGPGGEILALWTRASARPLTAATLMPLLPGLGLEPVAKALGPGAGDPVSRAATVIETVLAEVPQAEVAALLLADAVLARALGWERLVPLLGAGLDASVLRARGPALRQACHRAVLAQSAVAAGLAEDLARRAARLQAVAPKLRSRGGVQATALFLRHDVLAPTAFAGILSDRAARRFCARLVELGAVREWTGRDTFRLFGL